MEDCLTIPPPVSNGIHVSKPQPTAEGFEAWRRKNNWMDRAGSGHYTHIGNIEVLSFEELFDLYKNSL